MPQGRGHSASGTVIQGYFLGRPPAHVAGPPGAAALQRKTAAPGAGDAFVLPPHLAPRAGGPGEPLPDPVRRQMESFFATSFADVRVHQGPQAAALGALAFTQGSHLYFARGQFDPGTPRGRQLIGHELAHVVQQRAGRVRNPFGAGVAVVQDRGLEAEADRLGQRAACHRPAVQPCRPAPVRKASPALARPAVRAHALPASRVQPTLRTVQCMRKGAPTKGPIPERLEYDESADATTGAMNLYNARGDLITERVFASGGQHAEEKAIDHLQALVNRGDLSPEVRPDGSRGPYLVMLTLSKSPCSSTSVPPTRNDGNPGCHERLQDLLTNGLQNLAGHTVAFQVQYAPVKPYQAKGVVGAKQASRDNNDRFGDGDDGRGLGFGSFGFLRGGV